MEYILFAAYAVCFLLFLTLAINIWPETGDILQTWVYPGNVAETRNALHHMAGNIRAGVSLPDAVYAFCQEIVDGAPIPG